MSSTRSKRTIAILLAAAALAAAEGATDRPGGTWPRLYTDAVGRKVTLPAPPARIVSLAPSVTEMLFALGLGDRVVGVTDFCRVPGGSPAVARIGGLINPDLEKIVSVKPDLALATTSGNYLEDADRIARLGIPAYTFDTPSVEAVLRSIDDLGRIAGVETAAASLTASLRERLATVEKRVAGKPRPRVLFVIWGDPILAPGRGAFLNDALARAGAEPISSSAASRWVEYDLERVISARIDVILTVPDNRAFAESLASRPEWAPVPAVKSRRIHVVSDAIQQPGPRIVEAIEEIAAILHPEPPSRSR